MLNDVSIYIQKFLATYCLFSVYNARDVLTLGSCRYSKWVAKLNSSESWSVAYAAMSNSALCMFQSLCTIACAIEIAIESDE